MGKKLRNKINIDIWRKPYEPKIEHYNWNKFTVFKKGFVENGTLLDMWIYYWGRLRDELYWLKRYPYYLKKIRDIKKAKISKQDKITKLIALELTRSLEEKIHNKLN